MLITEREMSGCGPAAGSGPVKAVASGTSPQPAVPRPGWQRNLKDWGHPAGHPGQRGAGVRTSNASKQ